MILNFVAVIKIIKCFSVHLQDVLRYYINGAPDVIKYFTMDPDTGMLTLSRALDSLPGTRLEVGAL